MAATASLSAGHSRASAKVGSAGLTKRGRRRQRGLRRRRGHDGAAIDRDDDKLLAALGRHLEHDGAAGRQRHGAAQRERALGGLHHDGALAVGTDDPSLDDRAGREPDGGTAVDRNDDDVLAALLRHLQHDGAAGCERHGATQGKRVPGRSAR